MEESETEELEELLRVEPETVEPGAAAPVTEGLATAERETEELETVEQAKAEWDCHSRKYDLYQYVPCYSHYGNEHIPLFRHQRLRIE